MNKYIILTLLTLLLCIEPVFAQKKPDQDTQIKKEIEMLLNKIKKNRKQAEDLIQEAKAIAKNLIAPLFCM